MKQSINKSILFISLLASASLFFTACSKNDGPDPVPEPPAPVITGFTPTEGPVGTTVTITGQNFSTTASANTVKFDTATASVTSATTTELVVNVPSTLPPGQVSIKVTVNNKTATATQQFTIKPTVIPVKTTYWVRYTGTAYEIVKGALNADGSQTITKLYTAGADASIPGIALHSGTKDLFWIEQAFDLNTFTSVSVILKGDTTGAAAVTIIDAAKGLTEANEITVDAQNNKLYWTHKDAATGDGNIYSAGTDGSNITKMYSTLTLKSVAAITSDATSNALYFIETYDEGGAGGIISKIYKGNMDGSGMPVVLYDKTKLPTAGSPQDRFVGLAINGTSIYLADRSQSAAGISYIVKGSTDGSGTLAKVFESIPGTTNPLEVTMGLTIDTQHNYLYWVNQGSQSDGSKGTVYRAAIAAGSTPQLLFKNIQVAEAASAPIDLGK